MTALAAHGARSGSRTESGHVDHIGTLPYGSASSIRDRVGQNDADLPRQARFWCVLGAELPPRWCRSGVCPYGSSFRAGSNGKIAVADRDDSLAGLTASKPPALDGVAATDIHSQIFRARFLASKPAKEKETTDRRGFAVPLSYRGLESATEPDVVSEAA